MANRARPAGNERDLVALEPDIRVGAQPSTRARAASEPMAQMVLRVAGRIGSLVLWKIAGAVVACKGGFG